MENKETYQVTKEIVDKEISKIREILNKIKWILNEGSKEINKKC